MDRISKKAPNEWNVPDWSDASQYPQPDQLNLTQWRWQFLRRSAEYREDWEMYRKDTYPYKIAIEGDPNDSTLHYPYYPEEHEDQWSSIWRFLRKYGLPRLLDPSVPDPHYLNFHFVPFAADPGDNPEFRKAGVDIGSIPWKLQNPYLAWFDLSRPLRPQIDHYVAALQCERDIAMDRLTYTSTSKGEARKSFLESMRDEVTAAILKKPMVKFNSRPPNKRNKKSRRKQWPIFLRVLDARDMKEKPSWVKIGEKLFSDKADSSAQARMAAKMAQNFWWKIEIERITGPNLWHVDENWHDLDSVLPPLEASKPLLFDWLDKLPPRLGSIMFSSLS